MRGPCDECGGRLRDALPGSRVCGLCRRGIVGFEPGRIIYKKGMGND